MVGRKRLPAALKKIRGTYDASRDEPILPQTIFGAIPAPPTWLNLRASEIFRDVASISCKMKVMSAEDTNTMALLALSLWEVEELTEQIESVGYTVVSENRSGGTMQRINPLVTQRNDAIRRSQSLLSDFGLSPAARSKVTMNKEIEDNPFSTLESLE